MSPPPVVVSFVVLRPALCRVAPRSVVRFVLCPVVCGVLVSGWVLAPCCLARCCAGPCCPVFVLLCCPALLRSLLVLGSGLVPCCFCFCALLVRCCAGVPASLLFVRCSLALEALAGALCCCLLCLRVCCLAWLSSVVSWWLLVSCFGGVLWCVPGCCAAPCCCALCRLVLRCCALRCFVLLRLVLLHAVLCPGAPSVVLQSSAFWRRILCCPPALCVFCCGVSLRGVVRRCALCRVRPGVSCCALPVVSALCGVAVWPALPLCPAPLCCAPWCCAAAWCCGVLPCCLVVVLWRPALLPSRGAVASCPAALSGLFLACAWFHLLEKPLQNLLQYFFGF